jgi:cell division ATPase FtsA
LSSPLATAFFSSIDVGSTKVCAVVTFASSRGLTIVGHGVAARGGSDIEATSRSIRDAVSQAECRSRLRVQAVYASLSHVRGEALGLGLGASAARAIADRESLVMSLERAGLSVIDVVPSSLASAASALTAAERERGVVLLDVGANTTDVAIYEASEIVRTDVIDFGGGTLTSAIATRFGLSIAEAEFLKRNIGIAAVEHLDDEELVAVPNCARGAGKAIRRRELANVIEARLRPLWQEVRRSTGAARGGLVVTGGATLLQGFVALAELRLAPRPVRRAAPFGLEGLSGQLHSPSFSTAVGLAQYAAEHAGELGRPSGTWGRRRLASA